MLRRALSALGVGGGPESFQEPLWRALAVFRMASLVQVFLLLGYNRHDYAHPVGAWLAGFLVAAWSVYSIYAYSRPFLRGWPLLTTDLLALGTATLASAPIVGHFALAAGTQTLPASAIAGPVVAWAIYGGRRIGAIAALILGGCDLFIRGNVDQNTITGTVLLLLAAIAIGHISRLGSVAEERLAEATRLEAATRERDRLARGIHDSVLQVLALVARRAEALGGEAAELGRLAGEQEVALRGLIGSASPDPGVRIGAADLRLALGGFASRDVSIVAPATAVSVPAHTCDEIVAAVGSALDNVRVHAGRAARAWILVEDEAGEVTVTVRDDGAGIPAGRLEEAEASGRLGVAQSIRGRMRDLGGAAVINSAPNQGTEVELRVPKVMP